jgi:hypothetical protein
MARWRMMLAIALGFTVLTIPTLEGEGVPFLLALFVDGLLLLARPHQFSSRDRTSRSVLRMKTKLMHCRRRLSAHC